MTQDKILDRILKYLAKIFGKIKNILIQDGLFEYIGPTETHLFNFTKSGLYFINNSRYLHLAKINKLSELKNKTQVKLANLNILKDNCNIISSKIIFALVFAPLLVSLLTSCNNSSKSNYYRFISEDCRSVFKGRISVDKDIANKVSCYYFTYDSIGRPIKVQYLVNGKLAKTDEYEAAQIIINYTNRVESRYFLDEKGDTILNNEWILCEVIIRDENGNPISLSNFKRCNDCKNGLKLSNNKSGVATYNYKIDQKGRIANSLRFDSDNNRIADKDGVYERIYEYDDNDNLIKVKSIREETLPDDIVETTYQYDDYGNIIGVKNFNRYAQLLPIEGSIYSYLIKYDKNGNLIEIQYLGKNDELVNDKGGISICKYKYNEFWKTTESSCFGTNGKLKNDNEGIAITRWNYDQNNYLTKQYFLNSNNERTKDKNGVSKYEWVHDSIGDLLQEEYFNEYDTKLSRDTSLLTDRAKNTIFFYLLHNGSYDTTLMYYKRIIDLNPFDARVYYHRAILYMNNNEKYIEAKSDFEKAISYGYNSPDLYYNYGKLNILTSNYQDAVVNFSKAIQDDSTYIEAYMGRAQAKLVLGDNLSALRDCLFILIFASLDYSPRHLSSNTYYYLFHSNGRAEALFYAHYYRGLAYFNLEIYNASIEQMNLAISINDGDGSAYLYRGYAKYYTGDGSACDDFSKAGELGTTKAYDIIKEICN